MNLSVAVKLSAERLLAGAAEAKTFFVGAEIESRLQRGPADATQTLVSHRSFVVVLS